MVDEDNLLGRLYGYKAVPNLYLIEPDGTVAMCQLGTFNIRNAQDRAVVEAWVTSGLSPQPPAAEHQEAVPDEDVARMFAEGASLYRRGEFEAALTLWRRAAAAEPDNFNVRKQVWAMEHPERFYDGKVDFDWQREQFEREG